MSRFEHTVSVTNETTREIRAFRIAYGYDHPLSEYFIQVWDESIPDEEEDRDPLLSLGSRTTGTGRDEMYGVMKAFGVPEEHLGRLILDVPI